MGTRKRRLLGYDHSSQTKYSAWEEVSNMPFGLGPAGWAYMAPYAYPYAGLPYPAWPYWARWRGGWGCSWGRRRGWGRASRWMAPYRYP